MKDFFISGIRSISSLIDGIIAWVIDKIYELIMLLADVNIFGTEAIGVFSRRIYVLLSVFMLFKVSFSLINYLINPDEFHSKEQGIGKIINNTIIVLILIVAVPIGFNQLYHVQGLLLKNNTIGRIFLGVGSDNQNIGSGSQISFPVYSAFFQPNTSSSKIDMSACEDMYATGILPSACLTTVDNYGGGDAAVALKNAFEDENHSKNTSSLVSLDLVLAKSDGEYLFDYKWIISSIVGALVAFLLIGIVLDVAVRCAKLGFLQIIAPIPIITFIDPKSSKDGMFKRWLMATLKTFVDLFIRLSALFFAVLIISLVVTNKSEFTSSGEIVLLREHPFLVVLIIVGALMFANQVPGLIQELIPGAKLDGDFSLNPLKKIGTSPLASAALGGAVGATVGSAIGGVSSYRASRDLGRGAWRSLGSAVGGVFGGGRRGMMGGGRTGVGREGSIFQATREAGAQSAGIVQQRAGTTIGSRTKAQIASSLGLDTEADIQDAQLEQYEEYETISKAIDERAESEVLKNPTTTATFQWVNSSGIEQFGSGNIQGLKNEVDILKAKAGESHERYNDSKIKLEQAKINKDHLIQNYNNRINQLKATGASQNEITDFRNNYHSQILEAEANVSALEKNTSDLQANVVTAEQITDAETKYLAGLRQAKNDYINSETDNIIVSNLAQLNNMLEANVKSSFTDIKSSTGISKISNSTDLKAIKDSVESRKLELRISPEWSREHISRDILGNRDKGKNK